MRLSTSGVLLLLASLAHPQAFGRFGYTLPVGDGIRVVQEGFRVDHPSAGTVLWAEPPDKLKVVATSDLSQTLYLTDRRPGPQKVRVDLLAPGLSLHSVGGLKLAMKRQTAPILSWAEGSSAEGIATPPSKWVLVSYRESEPPLMLSFLGGKVSLKVSGKAGDWALETVEPYTGWIRVTLPAGAHPVQSGSASQLGSLVARVKALPAEAHSTHAPLPVSLQITEEDSAVVATWAFDGPGAVVPPPAVFAALGGYSCRILTPVRPVMDSYVGRRPLYLCVSDSLKVRFPVATLPHGRSVTVGNRAPSPPTDPRNAALRLLAAPSGETDLSLAQRSLSNYVQSAPYEVEPHTGARLPYGAAGTGLETCASYALLEAALTKADGGSGPSSLTTSLLWRRDWLSWMLWTDGEAARRRSSALASMASLLAGTAGSRLDAAMLHAGLAGERGFTLYAARLERATPPKLIEPMDSLRSTLFSAGFRSGAAGMLLSPVRAFGEGPTSVASTPEGLLFELAGEGTRVRYLSLYSSLAYDADPEENASFFSLAQLEGFGTVQLKPMVIGPSRFLLRLSPLSPPLPQYRPLDYVEVER